MEFTETIWGNTAAAMQVMKGYSILQQEDFQADQVQDKKEGAKIISSGLN